MKAFASLAEAKKTLITQVSILITVCVLLCMAGRGMSGNRFVETLPLSIAGSSEVPSELTIDWDGEEIPVEKYEIVKAESGGYESAYVRITLRPEKAGKYALEVYDADRNIHVLDVIRVDRFRSGFSSATGAFSSENIIILSGILFYLCLFLITLSAFRRLKGPLAYSYEAILCCGLSIFSLVALLAEAPAYIRHLLRPGFHSTWELLESFGAAGKSFVILTVPFIIVFSILLIISNIALLRHERPRFRNVLGLLLGLLMITAAYVYFRMITGYFQGSEAQYRIRMAIENIAGITFAYAECVLFSSMICGLRAAKHVPPRDRDYILILGCGFAKDGSLTPLIRGRVDKALEFWRRQKEETGKEAVIIPSGGQGGDEPMAEAEAMRRYIVGTGFPESSLIPEDRSANTYQNMQFSKKIIEECEAAGAGEGGAAEGSGASDPSASEARTAFVTTNYHVFRSGVWAGAAGLKAEGLGSRTKWWFWPNAFVRECIGLLSRRIIPELVCLGILIAIFSVFTALGA